MNNYKVGAYLRISQNDSTNESNSISNQRKLIRKYIKDKKDFINIKFYIDDGYTGTNFDRPSFRKLYKDIITSKIDVVIVKDLSRLGRNYLQLGKYLEEFSSYNIRLISINDNIDTINDNKNNSILIPIKNILNDSYTKDISTKIKTALKVKKQNGEFVSAFAPYGYKKDINDKHRLVIDDNVSSVVKRIFTLALKDYNFSQIAKILNEEKVLSPLAYKKDVLQCRISSNSKNDKVLWNQAAVSRILQNEIYCGTLIQKNNNEEIVIRNNHPFIIEENLFLAVQKKCFSSKCRSYNKKLLFSGFLKCSNCNKAMVRYPSKDNYIYYCSTYRKSNRKNCERISIDGNLLEKVVFAKIKERIDILEVLKEKIINASNSKDKWQEELQNNVLEFYKKKLKEKNYVKKQLLKDYEEKILVKDEYLFYLNEFSIEISSIEQKINLLCNSKYFEWIDLFLKYKNESNISKEILNDLVDCIYVFKNKDIEVIFKYNDIFTELSSFISL